MRGRGNIFKDHQRLNEMLALRRQNVGPSQLGVRYGVDHSTIIYHCKRNGVVVKNGRVVAVISSGMVAIAAHAAIVKVKPQPRVVIQFGVPKVVLDFDGQPINQGHDYAEYIALKRKREEEAIFNKARSKS